MREWFSTSGLARKCAAHPWRVVAIWMVLIVLAGVSATGLGDALRTDGNFTTKPDSVVGMELLDERMHDAQGLSEIVVIRSETQTVDDAGFQQTVEQVTSRILELDEFVDGAVNYYQAQEAGMVDAEQFVSDDRHVTVIPVAFVPDGQAGMADRYTSVIKDMQFPRFEVYTAGSLSMHVEYTHLSEKLLQRAEQFALPISAVILVVVFGALVAAGVPLALAFVSVFVALGVTAMIGRYFDLSFYVVNMIVMIGLAVGIDYALFIITRYREERAHGREKIEAIATTGATASKAVLFSGLTVIFALSGLLIMPSTIFRSLGMGAVLVVAVAVVAMLTLVPAMLSLLGDRINWPRRQKVETNPSPERWDRQSIYRGFWGRLTKAVMARPAVSALLTIALLGAMAVPFFDLQRGVSGIETMPDGDLKTAYTILRDDFSAGALAPFEIVIDAPRSPEIESGIERLSTAIAESPDILPVTSVQWNDDANLALITAIPASGANTDEAYDGLKSLRTEIIPDAFENLTVPVYVTGNTAFDADFLSIVDTYTPIIFAFVLGLSFLLLLIAFRSIVVPVKAIMMNLLSVAASYGLMVLVFQKGIGNEIFGFQQTPTIESWVPILLFCILFGLSMDYHVFLLSRVREHFDLTHDNRESVAVGLRSTARLITGAALIMVVVFGGFAAGDLVAFQQMGFGLAVAIFLDATVVRSILVPSSMALLGDRNWYLPSWLSWLPDLRIEGDIPVVPVVRPVVQPAGGGED
jgi:putative drug exporter of the RND superfamily